MINVIGTVSWDAWGLSLVGLLVGALVAHYLTKDRDAQARRAILEREAAVRRRHFRKKILECRYALERTSNREPDKVWERYAAMAPDLLAEAALVDDDFQPQHEFVRLVRRAGEWRKEDALVEARANPPKDLRDVLRDSIKDVYDFTLKTK